MAEAPPHAVSAKLDQLRTELADLAFVLECEGRLDAADVAMTVYARIGELCEKLAPARPAIRYAGDGCASRPHQYAG